MNRSLIVGQSSINKNSLLGKYCEPVVENEIVGSCVSGQIDVESSDRDLPAVVKRLRFVPVLPVHKIICRQNEDLYVVRESAACGEVPMKVNAGRSRGDIEFEIGKVERVYMQGGILDGDRALLLDDSVNRINCWVGICPLTGVVSVNQQQEGQSSRN